MDVKQLREMPNRIIEGDVDPSMGVVECPGHLLVQGDVRDESLVLVTGNITVEGYVGAAAIRSAKNITVHQGVAGQGYLDAGENITVKFANNSRFIANGDIEVLSSAMHCLLSAEGEIRIEGNEGFLVGGTANAGRRIAATRVGSIHSTQTYLRVGVSPLIRSELRRLVTEIDALEKRLDATRKDIMYLQCVGEQSRYGEQLPLYKLRASYLERELRKQYKRHQMTQSMLDRVGTQGDIQITGCAHPGVTVCIGWEEYTLSEELKQVCFCEGRGGIEWTRIASLDRAACESIDQ